MTSRISTILVLSLLAVVFVAMSAHAVKSPDESPRVINPRLQKAMHYALPYPDASNTGSLDANAPVQPSESMSLGTASSSSAPPFPGVKVGDTWYDYQHNGRMARMVDWGNNTGETGWGFMIHFLWMRLESEVQVNRHYAYNVYFAGGGVCPTPGEFKGQHKMQQPGEYAGYVSMDVTNDGRGVLSGHNNPGSGYSCHTYWDYVAGGFSFGNNGPIPNEIIAAGTGQDPEDSLKTPIWPSIRYQEHPTDENLNVLHIFAQVSEPGAGDPQAIIYFRKVGNNHLGVWDDPPYVVDTVHDIAQDVACSKTTGKAALVWVANLPSPATAPASSHGYWQYSQLDNDIWYQISTNYGASWGPMINVTQNVDGEAGYRPYTDLQALMTTDEHLHIIWSGRVWPADANTGGSVGFDCRIFQWGTDLAPGNIRTVANLEYDQTHCSGGAWQMQGSKMSIGECDGKLYGMWTQFNDPAVMMNDCHQRALDGGTDQVGAANGELYLAVSADDGLTWDAPRNLTNTHTSGCTHDPSEPGGPCRSEHWSNMNRLGTNLTGNMTGAVVVDPSGEYVGGYYLDVQYIADPDPGGIVQDEGTWQMADVQWFRLACVEPVPTAIFNPSWREIGFPEYTKHGTMYTKPLTIENSGNTALSFTFALNMDAGPYSTWLTVSSEFQGTVNVPSGTGNTITGDVFINADLTINLPGTIVNLTGNLVATGNQSTNPDTLPINFWVADTIIPPQFDTIYTQSPTCFALVVANTGNWGNQGAGHVNLDFFDYGDPDDLEGAEDTIPGDATVYAYDCSPVICWTDALDSVRCNWSIFGTSYLDDEAFFPWGHISPVDMGDFELYQSEFVTRDTGILIKKLWIAPYFQPGNGCNFMIQVLKIMRHPLATGDEIFEGLNIGEAMDWDIPSDSAAWNRSGFDMTNRLIYQQGSEFNQDNDVEKLENSDRYGGMALLDIVEIDGPDTLTLLDGEVPEQYGAYTEDNSTWVYPAGGFIEEELNANMTTNEGYVIETDSLDADLHAVMTFRNNYTLTPAKRLIIFKCLITSYKGYAEFIVNVEHCHAWYQEHLVPKVVGACCIEQDCFVMSEQACLDAGGTYKGDGVSCDPNPCLGCCNEINTPLGRGDIDYYNDGADDAVDISDLVYLVDYMFVGGAEPPCWAEANVDGSDSGDGVDGANDIDISDLVYLVDYMFVGGDPPLPCP